MNDANTLRMTTTRRQFSVIVLLSLALGACGGGSRTGPGSDSGPGADLDSGSLAPDGGGSTLSPAEDAGTIATPGAPLPDGAADCVGDPVTLPVVPITSDRWSYGNVGTDLMHPGLDCIDCHASGEGPRLTAAGTVMDAWHEPDDCFGTQGITVEITGADGVVTRMTTNETGNFSTASSIAVPYTVKLTGPDGSVREMFTPQTDLDCMHCHTQTGTNGAPGRIGRP